MSGAIARDHCLQALTPSSLGPPKFLHQIFPPFADALERRFGLLLNRFRMVHRNIQFRITDVLDVTFAYVFNRIALVKKNGKRWAGCSLDDINPIGSYSTISQSI